MNVAPDELPLLFRFKLEHASAPRRKSNCILLLVIARSFLALKKQNGLEMSKRLKNSLYRTSGNRLTLVATERSGEVAASVMPLRSGLRNHLSLFHQSLLPAAQAAQRQRL